ncbi:MAG TPA: YkvA family protein [Thermomicrobiales bacterium]|nr:YkvA family protein [Thermomicrobiales bacterium]
MDEASQGRQPVQGTPDVNIPGRSTNERTPGILPQEQPDEPIDGTSSDAMQRFWEAVKRLPAYIKLVARIARDPDVPKQAKTVLAVGGGYAVSPIDLVPGVIPVAGQIDDMYVLLTAIQKSLQMMPTEIANRNLALAHVSREEIDADLQAVRDVVRMAVKKSIKVGGKALERVSRAAFGFAREQLKRRNAGRSEKPL